MSESFSHLSDSPGSSDGSELGFASNEIHLSVDSTYNDMSDENDKHLIQFSFS